MKKEFTFDELISRKGCYSRSDVIKVFGEFKSISLIEILNSAIPLRDKAWFIFNSCDLTLQEQKDLSYLLVEAVVPIYNNAYPNDDRINNCMKGIKDFNDHLITKEELAVLRNAVNDAYEAVAGAANIVAYAVNAVIYAATTAHAVTVAEAAVNAAIYSNDASYKDKLLKIIIDFVNNN